jgi:glycerol uptake facilitator-like aquaporin
MWTYFKAEVVPAFIAFNIAFYTRGYFYPPPIPVNDWDSYRIILGELIGTFMLSFFLQRVCNSQTTFTTSDIETYSFVVVFVYVARRFAVTSGNSINPVATLAAACAAVVQCAFGPLRYFYLFVIGDLLGSIAGSLFYNCLYEPNLHVSRMEEERNSMVLK